MGKILTEQHRATLRLGQTHRFSSVQFSSVPQAIIRGLNKVDPLLALTMHAGCAPCRSCTRSAHSDHRMGCNVEIANSSRKYRRTRSIRARRARSVGGRTKTLPQVAFSEVANLLATSRKSLLRDSERSFFGCAFLNPSAAQTPSPAGFIIDSESTATANLVLTSIQRHANASP